MKPILFIIIFILFTTSDLYAASYTNELPLFEKNKEVEPNKEIRTNKTIEKRALLSEPQTPPHFISGFDWSLPSNTKITDSSGFIGDESNPSQLIKNRFTIVKWNDANPSKGQYDFAALESTLKRIAPEKVLVRLEVNSSCEAPLWALSQLQQTKHKSLIYWYKSYQDLTRPFIQSFAKRFAAHPQILGVQLGLADGEFGEATDSCNDYDNKQGWGEFWMSPSEREEAESQFGFNPDIFLKETIANIDIYADAFGAHANKLAFTNIGTLFTYGENSEPYNQNLKKIAKYALDKGIGNRDGAIERWMSYTDKVYGNIFTTMPDGSCRLDTNESYMRNLQGRFWGTENEFYGDKDYVINDMGPLKNHAYQFLVSSLRALQMRRNVMSIADMNEITHGDYKTKDFMEYLTLTLGKQIENTPDAFALMGERYIAPYRLEDQMDATCVSSDESTAKDAVAIRSFGRWLTESPENTQVENKPAIKIKMPASENKWYQGYYLPDNIDYEYFARKAKVFSFDLNDQLSNDRCKAGCEVEVKATFKDTKKTTLHIQVAEGKSLTIETLGDNRIKTANFTIKSKFNNQLQNDIQVSDGYVDNDNDSNTLSKRKSNKEFNSGSDVRLISDKQAIPLIFMRINFLDQGSGKGFNENSSNEKLCYK